MKKFLLMAWVMLMMSAAVMASTIEIGGERATPEYWLSADGDRVLLSASQIKTLNAQMRAKDFYSADLSKLPTQIAAEDVQTMLDKSDPEGGYSVSAPVDVQYAVTVCRANIRLKPNRWNGDNYDDDQATALDPAEPVAVFISSRDEKYFFCRSRNYFGWIDRNEIAFTDREMWLTYVEPNEFLVVVDHKKTVDVKGRKVLFQMGAVIPLFQTTSYKISSNDKIKLTPQGINYNIAIPAFPSIGTNHTGSEWLARLPISIKGRLREVYVPIADDNSINNGWLPCTQNNFVRQAFKFLGDEYGWGGLNDSVDCSAFVGDVYRSMGIELPRDTGNQESVMPIVSVFNDVSSYMRQDIVKRAPVGALLFKRGHVMMKLGQDKNGTPLIIHAASSYVALGEKFYIRKVIVSDLHYRGVATTETIDQLTTISFVANGG